MPLSTRGVQSKKIIFFFLNRNMCCWCSKDGSFKHRKLVYVKTDGNKLFTRRSVYENSPKEDALRCNRACMVYVLNKTLLNIFGLNTIILNTFLFLSFVRLFLFNIYT